MKDFRNWLVVIALAAFTVAGGAAVNSMFRSITVMGADGQKVTLKLTDPAPPTPPAGAASGVLVMPPSTAFPINGAALMKARQGVSVERIKATDELPAGWPGGVSEGQFRIACVASHMAFDDPIVYPGQPGKSHLHTFFGNSSVNGTQTESTLGELATFGESTCTGGRVNGSGYWVSSVVDISTSFPVVPTAVLAYYKMASPYSDNSGGKSASEITVPVKGLRMIAGNPKNTTDSGGGVYRWDCILPSGTILNSQSMPGASCINGSEVIELIYFPECWDGMHLDSPDHQSHMAYSNTQTGCPSTHPVPIPKISFNVHYAVSARSRPENWRLSSDTYALNIPAGRSAHGDWINGWDQAILTTIVNNCVKRGVDCHAHLLGDGRMIY